MHLLVKNKMLAQTHVQTHTHTRIPTVEFFQASDNSVANVSTQQKLLKFVRC